MVGSAAVDITANAAPLPGTDVSHSLHSTTPGIVSISLGGVGRNIAEGAHRILNRVPGESSASPVLVSLIGQDMFGKLLKDQTRSLGMRTSGLISSDEHSSAVCNMVLDSQGSLITGVADMDIIQSLAGSAVSSAFYA